MLIKFDQWQKEFIETEGDKILYTGRQVGKSRICAMDCGEYALTHPKVTILMIAPTERQAFELFDKTLNFILDQNIKAVCKGKNKPTQTKIRLTNGTIIWCLPVGMSGIGVRFLTINRLYGEEASRIPEKIWDAVTPMLFTTHGATILLSTYNGAQGRFYDVSINKNHAYDSFKRFTVSSEWVAENREVCETWTQEQKDGAIEYLKREKARMSSSQYAQEYLAIPSENIRRFFPEWIIEKACILKRRASVEGKKKYLGCDFGRMGEDLSTFEIIEKIGKDNFEQIENITTQKTLLTDSYDKILELEKAYTFSDIGLDSTGIGAGIYDFCLKESSVKHKVHALENAKKFIDADEKHSRKLMKEEMYSVMKSLMEKGKLKLLDDLDIQDSLRSIQFENNLIFSERGHIVEGLVRSTWVCTKDQSLDLWIA